MKAILKFKYSVSVGENVLSDGKFARRALVNLLFEKKKWKLFSKMLVDSSELLGVRVSNGVLLERKRFKFLRVFFGMKNCRRWDSLVKLKKISLYQFDQCWVFRLNFFLYKAGCFQSISQATSFITSGGVVVNQKVCTFSGYVLGVGDEVQLSLKYQSIFSLGSFFGTSSKGVCIQSDVFEGGVVEGSFSLRTFIVVGPWYSKETGSVLFSVNLY